MKTETLIKKINALPLSSKKQKRIVISALETEEYYSLGDWFFRAFVLPVSKERKQYSELFKALPKWIQNRMEG